MSGNGLRASGKGLSVSLEETSLRALVALGGRDYAVPLKRHIEESTGKQVAMGALYVTLNRLEKKGFVVPDSQAGDVQRANLPRRFFKITGEGIRALNEVDRTRELVSLRPAWRAI